MDQERLDAFVNQFVADLGTLFHTATVVIGDRLGLYRAMADGTPTTAERLAETTGTDARYVQEWLCAQAAAGYVDFDPSAGTFTLPEEHAFCLASEGNPVFVPGAFQLGSALHKDEDRITERFTDGGGFGWHEHHRDLFTGTDRFFRPGYAANLVSAWLPSLDGVVDKLKAGARVADIGCGLGSSTIIMAQAYPASTFIGYDYHAPSIELARKAAADAGVAHRATFEVATAKDFPGRDYDLVCCFDCLHDMGDPVGAAAHVRAALAPQGTWMLVEPFAGDAIEDNHPVGKIFYSASTLICVPASKAQEVGLGLGSQAGEVRIGKVLTDGGFTGFRRAAETPFNLVYEARP